MPRAPDDAPPSVAARAPIRRDSHHSTRRGRVVGAPPTLRQRTAALLCAMRFTTGSLFAPSPKAYPRPIAVRNGAGIEPKVDRRTEASAESGAGAALVCA